MSKNKAQGVLSKDEVDIRKLIERWAKAVRDGDRTGICTDHVPDILMFDVPPPLFSQGLDSYMATWERFLSWSEQPVKFDLHDMRIIAGKDVAFATALGWSDRESCWR
jgi:ketosteroid isomerase-like protein